MDYHHLGSSFPAYSANVILCNSSNINIHLLPYNTKLPNALNNVNDKSKTKCNASESYGLGCFLFARRYLGNGAHTCLFSFPSGTEMFYFPEFANQLIVET